jgi:tetratricopeptide (TPR) repeat protein
MRLLYILLLLLTSTASFAQSWATAQLPNSVASGPFDRNGQDSIVLSGKVIVTDGVPMPDVVAIEIDCEGNIRTLGYIGVNGNFDFRVSISNSSASETGSFLTSSLTLSGCELQAQVPGFVSEKVILSTSLDYSAGVLRIGNITIHSANRESSNAISATTLAAPSKAQKSFQKGRQEASKGEWKAAADHFREAVRIYPNYAIAWVYLGRVQLRQGDIDTARGSLQEALKADPKLVEAYAELAHIALRTKQWQELADNTDHILQLNPQGMPQFWYLNSAANYELRNIDKAEKSAMQGLRTDVGERVPRLQYLLGVILAFKQEYRGAAEHIRHYLRLAPHAEDAALAEKQLHELEKLSAKVE